MLCSLAISFVPIRATMSGTIGSEAEGFAAALENEVMLRKPRSEVYLFQAGEGQDDGLLVITIMQIALYVSRKDAQ